MIQFGLHTFLWKKEFLGQEAYILDQAQDWGADGVEIATHYFEQIDPSTLRRYREDFGLQFTLCTSLPQGLSLTTEDDACWLESIVYIQKAITFCQSSGITTLSGPLIHPVGYLSGQPLRQQEKDRMYKALGEVANGLVKTEVMLALEPLNRFQGYALNTVSQGLDLLAAVDCPQLGLLLDLFHMNIEEKDVLQAFHQAGQCCFHIHACAKDRGTPGADAFAWQEWFGVLQAIGYQGWMVIESFNFEDRELANGARLWRPVAPSHDALAREGLKFLRQTYQASLL